MNASTTSSLPSIPDHLWINIFEIGINRSKLDIRDLSWLSIACKNFNKLCKEDSLWSALVALDFPQDEDPTPCFSSQKALYKHRLHNQLKRKRRSIEIEVVADEIRLSLESERMKRVRLSVMEMKPEIEASSAELEKFTNERVQTRSSSQRLRAFRRSLDRLITIVDRVEEWWEVLADIIDPRESSVDSAAVRLQSFLAFAAATDSHSSGGPSSSTLAGSSPLADALVRLETVILDLSSDQQQDIRIREQLVPPIIYDLFQRWKEHKKQLDVISRRLVPFNTGLHPVGTDNHDQVAIRADGGSVLESG